MLTWSKFVSLTNFHDFVISIINDRHRYKIVWLFNGLSPIVWFLDSSKRMILWPLSEWYAIS